MTDATQSNVDPDLIQQRRSRSRLKLTVLVGMLITLVSAGVLVWLLGISLLSSTTDRSTIAFRVYANCPEPISASIAINAHEGLIWLALERPDLPASVDSKFRNAKKRTFFSQCGVNVEFLDALDAAVIPGSISGDLWPGSTRPPPDQILEIRIDPNTGLSAFELIPEHNPNFAGEILITPTELFARDSFGRFHMGVDTTIQNSAGMVELTTSLSLPEKSMQAEIIRPQPTSIGNTPIETYRFFATASPNTEKRWIDETYFIAFVDPAKIQIREALLVLASTLLGAGISALLEAFLASGTAVLVRNKHKEEENSSGDEDDAQTEISNP